LCTKDENKENKFDENNKIELQNVALLYIQERNNNNFVCAFFIIAIDEEKNDK